MTANDLTIGDPATVRPAPARSDSASSDSASSDPRGAPEAAGWRADSVCRQHPTRWWFAGGYRETILAKGICSDCLVRRECLEYALDRPDLTGIWAATTPNERARLRRKRREDPTVDVAALAQAAPPAHPGSEWAATTAAKYESSYREPAADPAATRPAPMPAVAMPAVSAAATEAGGDDLDELLTPAEAAARLGVTPNTVTRWSRAGKVSAIQTMGGHRRFRRSEIERVLREANGAFPAHRPAPRG